MRGLSAKFMDDLLKQEGTLKPILGRVKKDQTLMLAIRNGYLNVYYRGGNILRIKEHSKGFYRTFFDKQYNKSNQKIPEAPETIASQIDAQKWVDSLPARKNVMDEYFSVYGKAEREFQQLVARENNNSCISNETEYFITDIEFTAPYGRFDMLAVQWPTSKRKSGKNCKAALIEVKYGDGALTGKAGVLDHLRDMEKLIRDKADRYPKLLQTMENQFNQLDQLGLLRFHKGTSNAKVQLNPKDTPEIIFLIANHNPRSTKLQGIVNDAKLQKYKEDDLFKLRFYTATFAGYGLHTKNMHTLTEFKSQI